MSIVQGGVVSYLKTTITRGTGGPDPGFNVLIVDDEPPIRKFVERVVRQAGHTTTTAADGVEALAVAESLERLDLLVTDLMMPNMNGDELARRLLAVRPTVKVLYLSGFCDHLFKERVALWPHEAFLEKPCSVKGLMEAMSLLLLGRLETQQAAT